MSRKQRPWFVLLHFAGNVCGAFLIFTCLRSPKASGIERPEEAAKTIVPKLSALSKPRPGAGGEANSRPAWRHDEKTGLFSDAEGNLWFEVSAAWLPDLTRSVRPTTTATTMLTDEVASGLFLSEEERRNVDAIMAATFERIVVLEDALATTAVNEEGVTVISCPAWGAAGDRIHVDLEAGLEGALGVDRGSVLTRLVVDGEWFMLREGSISFQRIEREGKPVATMHRNGKRIAWIIDNDDSARLRFSHLIDLNE